MFAWIDINNLELSFTISWWWLFYAWLSVSYSAGIWGIRAAARTDIDPPTAVLGMLYAISPLWVPFWLLGRIITFRVKG